MKITALTCTGDRPVCLNLLSKWIANQTMPIDQWLVIDDGKGPFIPSLNCDYVYRKPNDGEGQTLNLNLQEALPHIKGDIIFFMEDDEYYAKDYVKTMVEKIQDYMIVGICKSKYYHLPTRTYFAHHNYSHASLAQTAIAKAALPVLKEVLDGDAFIDIRLWNNLCNGNPETKQFVKNFNHQGTVINNQAVLFDDGKDYLYVGMKGMPGRKGIGSGHKGIGRPDSRFSTLAQWIPDDWKTYFDLKLKPEIRGGK